MRSPCSAGRGEVATPESGINESALIEAGCNYSGVVADPVMASAEVTDLRRCGTADRRAARGPGIASPRAMLARVTCIATVLSAVPGFAEVVTPDRTAPVEVSAPAELALGDTQLVLAPRRSLLGAESP